ncbi:MAG TPA: hypothetical protein VK181_17185 [Rhizobium sp.]|nr:hypothetical protein [Rhizobium sp.]
MTSPLFGAADHLWGALTGTPENYTQTIPRPANRQRSARCLDKHATKI